MSRGWKFSANPEVIALALAKYDSGETMKQIATRVGCGVGAIRKILKRNDRNPARGLTHLARINDHAVRQQIIELNKQGVYLKEIARRLNYSFPCVRKVIRESGLPYLKHRTWGLLRQPVRINGKGYRELLMPDHPNANAHGYVLEHLATAAKALGHWPSRDREIVHHIDGDKLNNANSNLLICSPQYHRWLHSRMSELYQREHFRKAAAA